MATATKELAWFERDPKQVASEGIALQARKNWRKATIFSDPTNGDIVIAYSDPTGADREDRFSQTEFDRKGSNIARSIGFHVTP